MAKSYLLAKVTRNILICGHKFLTLNNYNIYIYITTLPLICILVFMFTKATLNAFDRLFDCLSLYCYYYVLVCLFPQLNGCMIENNNKKTLKLVMLFCNKLHFEFSSVDCQHTAVLKISATHYT